jgi:tetratricopeptide (TPR) repeat protein
LLYEFTRSHHTHGWLLLASTSVSYGKATAYLPVIDLLKGYCGIEPQDDARRRREKVTGKLLALDHALEPMLPAVLALLEVPVEDPQWLACDPLQRRQRTLEAITHLLLRESQVQPLCLVFEDLHWIDAETQALLDRLVESLPTARLLLLVNYRPEYQHPWGSQTSYTQLRLDPLPPANADTFLQALLGDDPSLAPLTPLLIARTQGNPFFLEESVRTLVETGVLVGERGANRLARPLESLQVPATVQAVLAARIDRLPPEEKRLLQTAAVIGTEVPWPLVQAIANAPDEALHRGMAHLQAAEFLYETSLFPERVSTFKHALTHEVAYGSLLQERRRVLHTRVVEVLEAVYPDRLTEQVERLAHHAFRGEQWAKALPYFRQAGAKAATHSAYREAVTCFEQALVALQHLPESQDRLAQGIELRLDLRDVLHPLGEIERIRDCLREAERLAETVADHRPLGRICSVLCLSAFQMGNYGDGLMAGQRALTIGEALGDVALQFHTHQQLGMNYHMLGDYAQVIACLQTAVALEGREGAPLVSRRSRVVSHRAWLSRTYAELGAFAEGILHSDEGMRMAEAHDLPYDRVSAYLGAGYLYVRQGDLPRAIAMLERGLDLCRSWHIRLLFPGVASDLGVAYALSGRITEALPLLERAVEQAASMRFMPYISGSLAALSEGYRLAGRPKAALPLAHRASEIARQHHEQGNQAWGLRLLGDLWTHRTPLEGEQAAAYYQQALALAEELGMRPLQAHCHRGLGTLYTTTGQAEQAQAALSTAIAMYQSMDMTFWLPETKAALAQVEGR